MLFSILLAAAPLTQLPPAPDHLGLSRVSEVEYEPSASGTSVANGLQPEPASASDAESWTTFRATVTSYLQESPPPPPPPPGPPVAPPAQMGLSGADATATGNASACDPYVDNLYADACCCDDDCSWKRRWKQHCYLAQLHSTCDLYPHYAYYPKYHGYYYFRPYNADHIPVHQQTVVRLGGDPRNPHSTLLLANLFRDVPPPLRSATKTRRQGPQLPHLEPLLDPKASDR